MPGKGNLMRSAESFVYQKKNCKIRLLFDITEDNQITQPPTCPKFLLSDCKNISSSLWNDLKYAVTPLTISYC